MSIPPADERTVPTTAPDWSAIEHNVFCPLCEYNLRGLIRPRCPECGYRFEWPEVLDPNRQPHPYLFEHHPERNFWSYRKTVNGACRPRQFWTSLHPTQPSRPWRLLTYAAIGTWLLVMVGLCFACLPALRGVVYARQQMPWLSTWKVVGQVIGQSLANGDIRRMFKEVAGPLIVLFPACWTLLSVGALMILQISLRRGKLKNVHLFRSAIYAADPGAWASVLLLLWMVEALMILLGWNVEWLYRPWGIMQTWGLCAVWTAWRLRQACRYYLRFTWPTATAILTQTVVLLAVLLVLLRWNTRLAVELMRAYGLG